MSALRPFISYFGSKWRAAPKYPTPQHRLIVEPFAGSAGYSLRYWHHDVLLVEKSEPIAAIWDYLIHAPAAEIAALPLMEPGQKVDDVPGLTQVQRWLLGMWMNAGSATPKKTLTNWLAPNGQRVACSSWGEDIRARLAEQVTHIRHWQIIHGDFTQAPDVEATWFVDPPYMGAMGDHYPCGSSDLDYAQLAEWCRARQGQALVCEAQGATWLPFEPLGAFKANERGSHTKAKALEALWQSQPQQVVLPGVAA